MFHLKLLTLLFKSCILFLFIIISSCNSLKVDKEVVDKIYVNFIPERAGMLLRNELLLYFPNQNYETSLYILEASIKNSDTLYLTDSGGFGTRGRVSMTVDFKVVRKLDKTVVASMSSQGSDSYNIDASGVVTRATTLQSQDNLLRYVAKNMFLKVYSIINKDRVNESNPSNSQ